MNSIHSDFWLPSNVFDGKLDHIKLAAHRQAISGFVRILTNKNIPVKYYVKGESYTDGNSIVISGDINRKNYDVIVGTALHEASHIVFTDFQLLRNMFQLIPQDILNKSSQKNLDQNSIHPYLKDIWNWVEDRFIDKMTFKMAPGYRGYYRAMYSSIWHSAEITKALQSDAFRDETLESYRMRIINLTNPNTDLDALNGLRDIAVVADINTIERLKNPKDRFDVSCEIMRIILDNIGTLPKKKKKKESRKDYSFIPGSNSDKQDENFPSRFNPLDDSDGDSDDEDSQSSDNQPNSSGENFDESDPFGGFINEASKHVDEEDDVEKSDSTKKDADVEGISKRQLKKFIKTLEKQLEFLDHSNDGHNTKGKTPISKEDSEKIQAVEESKTELKPVGPEINIEHGTPTKIDCIVIHKMTKDIMTSPMFPMANQGFGGELLVHSGSSKAVERGLSLGAVLGKKLKVRGETRSTKYTRQKSGKIDKRLISELGLGSESVFSHMHIDQYKDAFIHISIDASSSMRGEKFEQCLTTSVAIAKAASMIENLEVVISFRSTSNDLPLVVIAYDSRIEGPRKLKTLFPCLFASGTTPEGLCFEAILDTIPPTNQIQDSYFLNFSDGEPYFPSKHFGYKGDTACEHTRKQVQTISSNGVKIISYFIDGDLHLSGNLTQFQRMYGRNAQNIDVTNISAVATSMNKKFLEKV